MELGRAIRHSDFTASVNTQLSHQRIIIIGVYRFALTINTRNFIMEPEAADRAAACQILEHWPGAILGDRLRAGCTAARPHAASGQSWSSEPEMGVPGAQPRR